MNLPTLFFMTTALTMAASTSGAPLKIECPDRIALEAHAKGEYPTWEVAPDKGKVNYFLESIRVFDGHPDEMASLVPATTQSRGRIVGTWLLPRPEEGRSYWVACAYRNSMVLLTKRLPDTVSSCSLTQKTLQSGALAGIESFSCQ